MHPEFKEIIEDTIILRKPVCKWCCHFCFIKRMAYFKSQYFSALRKIDNNILKLDSAIKETIITINQPNNTNFEVEDIIKNLYQIQWRMHYPNTLRSRVLQWQENRQYNRRRNRSMAKRTKNNTTETSHDLCNRQSYSC